MEGNMSKETRVIAIFVSFLMLATFSIVTFGQGKSGAFPTGGADNPMLQGSAPAGTATPHAYEFITIGTGLL